jgi:hypothetical protein
MNQQEMKIKNHANSYLERYLESLKNNQEKVKETKK